ncbi:MAG: AAA family ATPase [Lachnospiraceae bacterium]|nr:AAA family ATPase [Lachnospiraceae bacterium]
MEILPSEYQQIDLSGDEKNFAQNIMSNDCYGILLLGTNPVMLPKESMHTLICSDGVIFLKFLNGFQDAAQFGTIMPAMVDGLYGQTVRVITSKLLANRALVDECGKLKFAVNVLYVFPAIRRDDVKGAGDEALKEFTKNHCLFKEDLPKVRSGLPLLEKEIFAHPVAEISSEAFEINDNNINSILQRIAPDYVTIRVSTIADPKTKAGADGELLVVTENDVAVRAFRLDAEQINIVNKISKGDQLILACAGAGKSVLLIAKCFRAAMMNPDKQFLITCYNNNLCSLYTWFIDCAGLRAKNVVCLTFHTLCKKLLSDNGYPVVHRNFDGWVSDAIQRLNAGQISNRYYGIFIDEVQQFESEWYKFCFNLLENKTTEDHLFVICGDKTQKLANLQRHGRAPWNAGKGYPNYRGGNKSIRIERNYRNCIEINEYVNRYVSNAKQYLYDINQGAELDPDEFLCGKSVFHGEGVTIRHLMDHSDRGEAKEIAESIRKIHDEGRIPYDEIAVIMFNKSYKKSLAGWNGKPYDLETPLMGLLKREDIPFCTMYGTDESRGACYDDDGGVRLISVQSTLGLDFRAAIVCGLVPLGEYHGTRNPDWERIRTDEAKFQEMLKHTEADIRFLYVACTRAKEILHIILPETGETSVYVKMLEDAE